MNFEKANGLDNEAKLLIVNAQNLLDESRRRLKDQAVDVDLTCKLQLKSDCKEVEKLLKVVSKGKANDKTIGQLSLAVIRLKTSAENILKG